MQCLLLFLCWDSQGNVGIFNDLGNRGNVFADLYMYDVCL